MSCAGLSGGVPEEAPSVSLDTGSTGDVLLQGYPAPQVPLAESTDIAFWPKECGASLSPGWVQVQGQHVTL